MSEYEKELLAKIDAGEELTEYELKELIEYEIDSEDGEHHRWYEDVYSVCKLGDRFFEVHWCRGLTEYQENEYQDQPDEVEKLEYDKTIHVVEWVIKK